MELDNDTLRRKELNIVVSQLSIDTILDHRLDGYHG